MTSLWCPCGAPAASSEGPPGSAGSLVVARTCERVRWRVAVLLLLPLMLLLLLPPVAQPSAFQKSTHQNSAQKCREEGVRGSQGQGPPAKPQRNFRFTCAPLCVLVSRPHLNDGGEGSPRFSLVLLESRTVRGLDTWGTTHLNDHANLAHWILLGSSSPVPLLPSPQNTVVELSADMDRGEISLSLNDHSFFMTHLKHCFKGGELPTHPVFYNLIHGAAFTVLSSTWVAKPARPGEWVFNFGTKAAET